MEAAQGSQGTLSFEGRARTGLGSIRVGPHPFVTAFLDQSPSSLHAFNPLLGIHASPARSSLILRTGEMAKDGSRLVKSVKHANPVPDWDVWRRTGAVWPSVSYPRPVDPLVDDANTEHDHSARIE